MMTGKAMSRAFGLSLKSKIFFGFIFSIIPMLAIVAITYFPARDAALKGSHRQISLISSNGADQLDFVFATMSKVFLSWVEEDIFGMAIEFDAIDELNKHFMLLQTDNPEFSLLLLTDKNGKVLAEGRSSRFTNIEQPSMIGSVVKEIETFLKKPDTPVLVIEDRFSQDAEDKQPMLVYRYRTADSAGNMNGYLLAYLNAGEIKTLVDGLKKQLRKGGFSTAAVGIVDSSSGKTILFSSQTIGEKQGRFSDQMIGQLEKVKSGEIGIVEEDGNTRHVISYPLTIFLSFVDAGAVNKDNVKLNLIAAVEEQEMMARVRKTLLLSIAIAGSGLLVILLLGYVTIRTITKPIGNLVDVLQRYAGGDLSVRAEIQSHDEIGYFTSEFNTMLEKVNSSGLALKESESRYRALFEGLQDAVNSENYAFRFTPESKDDDLSLSLNKMLKTMETASAQVIDEDWLKTGVALLNTEIGGEHDVSDLCQRAITFIAGYTGAQVGTIFTKKENRGSVEYELVASYAFKTRKGLANKYLEGEGLVGQAAREKKLIHFNEVPDDYIKIESSLGQATPVSILVIPLVYENDVKGIIELGASFQFTERQLLFAEQVSSVVAVAINAASANSILKTLLEKTTKQSETLKTQQEELQKANEELEEQTQVLKESEARLQVQQEELQASNEEMEEKNQLLEEQKRENEEKTKNIEEKARQLELATKYKSEFLSNMSHELRTPLNSILLLAKMLSDNEEKNLSEDQIESAAAIHRGGQTLLHLINDILDLSKIEAGRVELNISAMSPQTVKTDFEMEFNHLAKSKGIEFSITLADNLPPVIITDVYRLEQIIRNLLGNAFKFTETGSVSLLVSRVADGTVLKKEGLRPDNTIQISVTDTGSGIPGEKLTHIFEAFRQVDGSISRKHGGTGLGLSISKELVRLLGGEIVVESTLNQGSTFTVFIPVRLNSEYSSEKVAEKPVDNPQRYEERKRTDAQERTTQAEAGAIHQVNDEVDPAAKRMLIIEDDEEFASILINFFKKNGYDSLVAPTGEKGMKYAIEYKPTAIILDIGLPGIDGWTVLNELKNNPDTRHIPVHIMSAYDNLNEGLKKGAVGYLTKPVSIEGLRSALGKIEHVLVNSVKELLVVEDDKELRNSILKLMGTQDIHVTTAETGAEAKEQLHNNRFDCMILDLGLPDISGFTLLDEIERDSTIEKLPVIIYTGRDLTLEETERLGKYSTSIVLKNALSMERLLDETALFMHRVEQEMPEAHRRILEELREKDSNIAGKRVLIVDDDMRNAFALSKFLKNKGVEITIADNGQKALELLESEAVPDIVLMDIMMPVMDGYETMKRIRGQNRLKDLPILALTAKAMDTDREECIRCGANDYLSKPIDTKKLLSMLRIWMY